MLTADRTGFEREYTTHYDPVLRYSHRRTGHHQALDATAETFAIAWRRRSDLPMDHPLPWLYGVAKRVLANQNRSGRRQRRTAAKLRDPDGLRGLEPEPIVVRDEEQTEVLEALGRLADGDQEILRLALWEELPREQISAAMRCSPNAATKRLNRALDHLARELVTERVHGTQAFRRERRSA